MTTLADLGTALHGPRWRTATAKTLEVAPRTIDRWAAGEHPVPEWVIDKLREALVQQRARITALLRESPHA